MCGRFALTLPPEAVRKYFGYADMPNFPPRYNIAPTQPIAIMRADETGLRRFGLVRWGFIPGFVKDLKTFPLLINARSETAAEKASFRNAFRRRRCIVMADGFYEWRREGRARHPFLIRRPDGAPLAFASLWECWHSPDGSEVDTACILTGTANGTVAAIHDRMPIILEPKHFDLWLDPATSPKALAPLLRPASEGALELVALSPRVNSAAYDDPSVQVPVSLGVSTG